MNVELLKADDIELVDSGLSQCYAQKKHGTNNKAQDRIMKVCNVYKHDSLLEFGSATWEITASAKTLLQLTRHRMASYAVQSTRYTLNRSELVFELTGDDEIDNILEEYRQKILRQIELSKKNDIVSMMLPMAFQYKFQVQFNYRSLKNFFALRLDKHAQKEIREMAEAMLDSLPVQIQELVS